MHDKTSPSRPAPDDEPFGGGLPFDAEADERFLSRQRRRRLSEFTGRDHESDPSEDLLDAEEAGDETNDATAALSPDSLAADSLSPDDSSTPPLDIADAPDQPEFEQADSVEAVSAIDGLDGADTAGGISVDDDFQNEATGDDDSTNAEFPSEHAIAPSPATQTSPNDEDASASQSSPFAADRSDLADSQSAPADFFPQAELPSASDQLAENSDAAAADAGESPFANFEDSASDSTSSPTDPFAGETSPDAERTILLRPTLAAEDNILAAAIQKAGAIAEAAARRSMPRAESVAQQALDQAEAAMKKALAVETELRAHVETMRQELLQAASQWRVINRRR